MSVSESSSGVERLPIVSHKDAVIGLCMEGEIPESGIDSYHLWPDSPPSDFFLDERLMQLREVNNPHHFRNLNEFELEWFKERAKPAVKGGQSN